MHQIEFVDAGVMGYSHVCDLLSGYVFIVSGNQSTAVVFRLFTSAAASHCTSDESRHDRYEVRSTLPDISAHLRTGWRACNNSRSSKYK